jgi:methylase of polypeptide subunit release factors
VHWADVVGPWIPAWELLLLSGLVSNTTIVHTLHDAMQWSFRFGRAALIRALALHSSTPERILEVGCGSGHNLLMLCQTFPAAQVIGLDLSADMLRVAGRKLGSFSRRVTLLHGAYDPSLHLPGPFHVILFSSALTMRRAADNGKVGLTFGVPFSAQQDWAKQYVGN